MEAKLIYDNTELSDKKTKFLESLIQRITDQQRSIPVCAIDANFERRLAHQMFINELKLFGHFLPNLPNNPYPLTQDERENNPPAGYEGRAHLNLVEQYRF